MGGAELAFVAGELAAHGIARQTPDGALRRRRDRLRRFARTMAAAHAPRPGWTGRLREDTDVCCCEEVTAGRIQEAVAGLGVRDTRTVGRARGRPQTARLSRHPGRTRPRTGIVRLPPTLASP